MFDLDFQSHAMKIEFFHYHRWIPWPRKHTHEKYSQKIRTGRQKSRGVASTPPLGVFGWRNTLGICGLTLRYRNINNNLMKNSFVNRHINCWNCLPNCTVHANSVGAFKRELDKIWYLKVFKGSGISVMLLPARSCWSTCKTDLYYTEHCSVWSYQTYRYYPQYDEDEDFGWRFRMKISDEDFYGGRTGPLEKILFIYLFFVNDFGWRFLRWPDGAIKNFLFIYLFFKFFLI